MSVKVQIDTNGIKKVLKNYRPEEAIAEYIWNGFDAGATQVSVNYEEIGGLGALGALTIQDDGSGIEFEGLISKFKPFLHSDKQIDDINERHHSTTHGKNGYGRLTFFCFADSATWETEYKIDKEQYAYEIKVTSNTLEKYEVEGEKLSKNKATGTKVTFEGIHGVTSDFINKTVKEYLQTEFGWFLELYKNKGYKILINGVLLTYEEIIGERDSVVIDHPASETLFSLEFVRWNKPLKNEYSKFYLIDNLNKERWKGTTKLNNKGDEFYHSIYIRSAYFDTFTYSPEQEDIQTTLMGHSKSDDAYKYLEEEITKFLRNKRRPFLEIYVGQKVDEYKKDGIIPMPKDEWDIPKNTELTNVIKGLYIIQPKIFSTSSEDQKKIFVRLLGTLLDTNERESILKIVDEVLGLDENEKKELFELLKVTKLSNIVRTAKLIEERFAFADQLKQAVFNKTLKANERDHLQKLLDNHFWIFGEEYSLVSTTEAKFEKALTAHQHLLTGNAEPIKIIHEDKDREMDLFLCRQNMYTNTVENLIIEIKSPTVNLGMDEVNQVKKYKSVIMSLPECSAKNMTWRFILVGNKFDSTDYVNGEIESAKTHGEKHKGLIYSVDNCKIYVKTWAEILTDFDCKHKYLQDKIQIDKEALSKNYENIDSLMSDAMPKKITPRKPATTKKN